MSPKLIFTDYVLRITHHPQKMKTHKDLDVWKEAMTLVKGIYRLTADFPKEETYGLVSQILEDGQQYQFQVI